MNTYFGAHKEKPEKRLDSMGERPADKRKMSPLYGAIAPAFHGERGRGLLLENASLQGSYCLGQGWGGGALLALGKVLLPTASTAGFTEDSILLLAATSEQPSPPFHVQAQRFSPRTGDVTGTNVGIISSVLHAPARLLE